MGQQYLMVPLGVLAGLVLVAASCAPAGKPAAPAPAIEQPAAEQPAAAKPAAEKPAAEKPQPKPAAEKPTVSVSGIPLDPSARYGGVLVVSYGTEGPSFNNWEEALGNAPSVGHPLTNQILQLQTWGTLEDFKAAAYFKVHPDLATSWEQSKNGLQWTFRLRDKVTFSDGDPFSCEDAKWTLDTIRTGAGLRRSPRAVHFKEITNIQCPDALTMVINMKTPKASLPDMIALGYNVVVNKSLFLPKGKELATSTTEMDDLRNKPPIGTGPFLLKERLPAERYVFVRRDDYWNKPLPYLDGIEQRYMNDTLAAAGLRAGRLDLGSQVGSWYAAGVAEVLARECQTCQVYPKTVMPAMMWGLVPNMQRPPWNTPEVRDALSLALDRRKIIDLGYGGWGVVGTGGLYLPGSFWAMPYERVKQVPGWNFEDPEGNKKKARELLAKAGYKPGELKFTIPGSPGYRVQVVVGLEELQAAGFDAKVQPLEAAGYYDVMSSGDFDVGAHAGWIGGFDPDILLYEHFYTGADRNYGRYSNPTVDRLIDEQALTIDPQERRRKAWDVAEIIMRDQARTQGGYLMFMPILGQRVRGFLPGPSSSAGYGPWHRQEHVWLAQ